MLLSLNRDQAEALRAVLRAYDAGQRQFEVPGQVTQQTPGQLRLVRTEAEWLAAHEGTASHQTGINQAKVLTVGTGDDDPLVRLSAQATITTVSGSTVTITADAGRVIVGSVIILTGCGSDDGEHAVTAVTQSGSSCVLTLSPDLTVTSPGGAVILPEAWGWNTTDSVNSVVSRADHRVIVVGRIGHEWHVLGEPVSWVVLDAGLSSATVTDGGINRATAAATVLELNDEQNRLTESDRTITVGSFDESLNLAPNTLCLVRLIGARWHIIWASCNTSGLRS